MYALEGISNSSVLFLVELHAFNLRIVSFHFFFIFDDFTLLLAKLSLETKEMFSIEIPARDSSYAEFSSSPWATQIPSRHFSQKIIAAWRISRQYFKPTVNPCWFLYESGEYFSIRINKRTKKHLMWFIHVHLSDFLMRTGHDEHLWIKFPLSLT